MKYVVKTSTPSTAKGFITHEDQERDGLAFSIFFLNDQDSYVLVEGDEKVAQAWIAKNKCEIIDAQTAMGEIEPQVSSTHECSFGFQHPYDKVKFIADVQAKIT